MRVRPTRKSVCTVAAIAMAAAIAACSTATKNATGPGNTGGITKGDTVNLTGSFNLASFTGQVVDSSDGATLVLTKTTYSIHSTGLFDCMLGTDSGSYVAIDTASATGVVNGTIVLTSVHDSTSPQLATFATSNDSLQVNVSNNGSTTNTVWIK
jgi:hypothetical protein